MSLSWKRRKTGSYDKRSGERGNRACTDLAPGAEDAAQMLLALEAREGELYHPDDDEEGFAQAKRREAVSADEIAVLFKQRDS